MAASGSRAVSRGALPAVGETANGESNDQSLWARKTVLCLDGGGIRGYASLIILRELMSKIESLETHTEWMTEHGEPGPAVRSSSDYPWQDDVPDPDAKFYRAHYFDYISGTSTGGLSAIMLGRLRMSVPEALTSYQSFGNSVFGHPRWFHERSKLYWFRSKYPTKVVVKAMLEIIRQALNRGCPDHEKATPYQVQNETLASSKETEHRCRTMAISFKKERGVQDHFVYRSFNHLANDDDENRLRRVRNPGPACTDPIWHAARATSAAPTFFEAHCAGEATHIDGGLGANNPAMITLQEVHHLHPYAPRLCVSIGTGEKTQVPILPKKDQLGNFKGQSRRQFLKKYLEIGDMGRKLLTNKAGLADNAAWVAELMGCEHTRLDVPSSVLHDDHCLGEVPLDEWLPPTSGEKTTTKITAMTREYLAQPAVQAMLDANAKTLVLLRRGRAKTDRWERYATDTAYRCTMEHPCTRSPELRNRPTFRRHVEERHPNQVQGQSSVQFEQTLSRFRTRTPLHARRAPTRVMSLANNGVAI